MEWCLIPPPPRKNNLIQITIGLWNTREGKVLISLMHDLNPKRWYRRMLATCAIEKILISIIHFTYNRNY